MRAKERRMKRTRRLFVVWLCYLRCLISLFTRRREQREIAKGEKEETFDGGEEREGGAISEKGKYQSRQLKRQIRVAIREGNQRGAIREGQSKTASLRLFVCFVPSK